MAVRRRGYSFIEVMFAIVILAIGASMMAALFTVSIGQTRQTVDETMGAAVARNAHAYLSTLLRADNVPVETAAVNTVGSIPFTGAAVSGTQIDSANPRYGWTALYRRESALGLAEMFIWVVRAPTDGHYGGAGMMQGNSQVPAIPEPRRYRIRLENRDGEADRIQFYAGEGPGDPTLAAIASGCFVVVASDPRQGRSVGQLYRVGEAIDAVSSLWSLSAGHEMQSDDENVTNATGFVVGRRWVDPLDPSKGCEGAVQDVLMFRALIALAPGAAVAPPPPESSP